MSQMTSVILVWDGDIGATLTCACGIETFKNIYVGDVVECDACHRVWRLSRTVACEPATEQEVADYHNALFGSIR
jgi:hypothetical protein